MSDFVNLKLKLSNMDTYIIRSSIYNSILMHSSEFHGRLLDFGCGKMPYKELIKKNSDITEYVGLDIEGALIYNSQIKPDYFWNGLNMPFENEVFNVAFGTEVLEHCSNSSLILDEIYRVLKPNGVIFGTVPFVWPLHEAPADEYRFTPYSLQRLLIDAGFKEIKIIPHGGWNKTFAQVIGLWCRRSIGRKSIKFIASLFFFPIYAYLLRTDKVDGYKNGSISPGWTFIAVK